MYNWKDKMCDGIAIGLIGLTTIPLVIFSIPLLMITRLIDKFWLTNYKDGSDHWQM